MTLRNNAKNTTLPGYSRKQEIFNFVSHLVGIPLALFIFFFGLYLFNNQKISGLAFSGLIIFSLSALIVYLFSSIYHITKSESSYKKKLRIVDHCTIYLLIAGTYTPVSFALLRPGHPMSLGVFMLVFQWTGVIIGFVLNAFFFHNKVSRIISFVLYVLMGWLAVLCGATFHISLMSFLFILIGGIIYTIGSILYAFGHGWKWFHCIFHIFVLFGTIIQTIGVFLLY